MRYFRFTKTDNAPEVIEELEELGFKHIPNPTLGGDHDFIVVDHKDKTWTHGEFGFSPFDHVNINAINMEHGDKSLKELTDWKYYF